MNKYTLSFRNPLIEEQYQAYQQKTQRALVFDLVSIGYIIAFGLRLIQAIIGKDQTYFYYKIAIVIYLVLQYIIVKWKPQYIRIAFSLINFTNLILNSENDTLTTLEISYLKGANAMAANFLIILAGEFPESIFVFLILTAYRLISAFIFGAPTNISVIFSTLCINLACFFYFYFYHKAKRSQYLLSLVDNCWDKILSELITGSYILLKFDYENIKFTLQKVQHCQFLKQQSQNLLGDCKNEEVKEFLRNAMVGNKTLEEEIYQYIKEFKHSYDDNFKKQLFVRYEKKMIEIEVSIFSTSTPTILLKLSKGFISKCCLSKHYQLRFFAFNQFIIKLLKDLEQNYYKNKIKCIRRKLIQLQLFNQIFIVNQSSKILNMEKIVTNLQNLYPQKIITLKKQLKICEIKSLSNIFLFIIMKVLENSLQTETVIEINKINQETTVALSGHFDIVKIDNLMKRLVNPLNQIITEKIILPQTIQLKLYNEPLVSYNLN